jgi:ABC-type spermidine/putrescine transport system permease subunit II
MTKPIIKTTASITKEAQPVEKAGFSFESFTENMEAQLGFKIPTGRRMIIGLVAQLLTTGLGIYAGMQLSAYLMVGAAVLTGSAFLTWMVGFLVLGIAIVAAIVAGGKAQSYILSGGVDRTFEASKNWVTGLFSNRKPKLSVATS